MKPKLYSALTFLNIMFFLCITACTRQPESKQRNVQHDEVKDTSTKRPSNSAIAPDQPLTSVASIQKAYADIVAKSTGVRLDSVFFKYSCHGEKGGTVTYFTEKGQLQMIIHRYNEYDHYSAEDRYFVKDSTLFFALTKSVSWYFESGAEGTTKDNIKESRVYLVGGKPVKCLEKKFTIRSHANDNPRSETLPNIVVVCPPAGTVMKPFLLLTKYRNKPTTGCLN